MVKVKKIAVCLMLVLIAASMLTACGSKKKNKDDENETAVYDENGNLIEEEEASTLLLPDSEVMSTGLMAVMDDGSITDNGIWLAESEVGSIADRYSVGEYKYEKGSFKKKEVKYVASFYDINGELVSSMYFNENMDMCYDNKYMIRDSVMRGIFTELKNSIKKSSVIDFDANASGIPTDADGQQGGSQTDGTNNIISLSTQAFMDAGLDEETAGVLAQSTFNLGIPVIKLAKWEANTILFTDMNNTEYTLSISNGRISSVYDETHEKYLYNN